MELEDQDNEFSVTGDISDKLANPEETSKAKKKRKAQEKQVRISTNRFPFFSTGTVISINLSF